jgi:hypothetical protein
MGANSGGASGGATLIARSLAAMRYLRRAHLTVIPRKRGIQYAAAFRSIANASDYWIARLRGR